MRKIYYCLVVACCYLTNSVYSQVAISSDASLPDPSAMLHVKSTSRGVLFPALSSFQKSSILLPSNGLIVFQTDGTQGFYYNAGSPVAPVWRRLLNDDPALKNYVDLSTIQTIAGNKTFTSPLITNVSLGAEDAIVGRNLAGVGTSGGSGVVGITSQASFSAAGVWAENPNSSGTALIAIANGLGSTILPNGSGLAATGFTTGVYAKSGTVGTGQALYADQFGDIVRVGYYNGTTFFKINGSGSVSTIIRDDQNNARTMFAAESPEVLFTDYGHGKLTNGKAHIQIDPIFSGTVTINDAHPLRVYIQVEGECNGVYVTNKSGSGFDVVELMHGTSNIEFSYQIVANRADEIHEGKDEKGNIQTRISKNADQRFPIDKNYKVNFRPLSASTGEKR